jgi:hypothetical protein
VSLAVNVTVMLEVACPLGTLSVVVGALRSMCAVAECALSELPALSVERYLIVWPSLVRIGLLDEL